MSTRIIVSCTCLAALTCGAAAATAQSPATQAAFPYAAEITADDVYVRSGPGSNYYPTTKLQRHARVRVVGEQFGWMQIEPPPGSFSYVDMTMVDKDASGVGTIRSDQVRVRAGSSLGNKKQEVQMTLSRGAKVTITGEADGFYKILPPPGAYLWVSGQYLRRLDAAGSPAAATTAAEVAATQPMSPTTRAAMADAGRSPPPTAPPGTAGAGAPPLREERIEVRTAESAALTALLPYLSGGGPHSEKVRELETQLAALRGADSGTPAKRDLARLLAAYEPIAAQTTEPIAKAVAEHRVRQLRLRMELLEKWSQLEADARDLDVYRQQLGEDRRRIGSLGEPPKAAPFDLKGELRTSQVFSAQSRRYRLVDPAHPEQTLAYVEAPAEIEANIRGLVGQYVGVRVGARLYGSNLGVPLVTASEVTRLTPDGRPAEAGITSQPAASQAR